MRLESLLIHIYKKQKSIHTYRHKVRSTTLPGHMSPVNITLSDKCCDNQAPLKRGV